MTLETNFHLLIRGVWVPVPDVQTDIKKSSKRGRSTFEAIGNVLYEQIARKANVTWDVEYADDTAESLALLTYAASGKAGPLWMYDVQAAQVNMLSENNTQGSQETVIMSGRVPMPAFAAGDGFVRKLRGGLDYHLSYTTTMPAGATVGTYVLSVGDDGSILAPSGSGPRRGSRVIRAEQDTDLTVAWSAAGVTTAARLTEGSVDDAGWLPGENTPCRVVVDDRQQILRSVSLDRLGRSDATFQIREVG